VSYDIVANRGNGERRKPAPRVRMRATARRGPLLSFFSSVFSMRPGSGRPRAFPNPESMASFDGAVSAPHPKRQTPPGDPHQAGFSFSAVAVLVVQSARSAARSADCSAGSHGYYFPNPELLCRPPRESGGGTARRRSAAARGGVDSGLSFRLRPQPAGRRILP
jgi:hypothetical protein